jgi:hypothetical protein
MKKSTESSEGEAEVLLAERTKAYNYKIYNRTYKDECLFVCLYLIQIRISESIGTKLRTHLPRRLEETVGYVWSHNI